MPKVCSCGFCNDPICASCRFLPFPYASIASVEDWKLQAKTMADKLVVVPYHWLRARDSGASHARTLELPKGWKFAFMGGCILGGLMAVKASHGNSTKLKTAAVEEACAAVQVLDSDTVPTLQAKSRPVVATIRSAEPKAAAKASSRSLTSETPVARTAAAKAATSARPAIESKRSSSWELMTAAHPLGSIFGK
eukprot:s1252_g18.t1